MARIHIVIDEKTKKEFFKKAREEGYPPSVMVRKIIKQIIKLDSWSMRRFMSFGISDFLQWEKKQVEKLDKNGLYSDGD
jgi:hypothetical protein